MRKFLIKVNDQQYEVEVEEVKGGSSSAPVAALAPKPAAAPAPAPKASKAAATSGPTSKVTSPMPGNILKIKVNVGDTVKRGQSLLILEAMKMENDITAPADGKVIEIQVTQGQAVTAGQVLVVLG